MVPHQLFCKPFLGPPCTPQALNKCLQIAIEVLSLQPGEYSLASLYWGSQFKSPWKIYSKPVGNELRLKYEEQRLIMQAPRRPYHVSINTGCTLLIQSEVPASSFGASQIATKTCIYAHGGQMARFWARLWDSLLSPIRQTVMGLDVVRGPSLIAELAADKPRICLLSGSEHCCFPGGTCHVRMQQSSLHLLGVWHPPPRPIYRYLTWVRSPWSEHAVCFVKPFSTWFD